jgi:hypothetical protein
LRARGFADAAELLESLPFEMRRGENFFGDEFVVLYAELSISQYAEIVEHYSDRMSHPEFRQMAAALKEIYPAHVRFIAFNALLTVEPPPIEEPVLEITSQTVEAALADARQLISSRGSTSGVDRAHTAFHGYLQVLCQNCQIQFVPGADVTTLFRLLREQHPSLRQQGARAEDITRLLRALATIIDTLNPLRNQATLAHPNLVLLEPAEADLVLNSILTLLHYLNKKLV